MTPSERQKAVAAMGRWEAKCNAVLASGNSTPFDLLAAAVDWLRAQGKFSLQLCESPEETDWIDDTLIEAALYVSRLALKLRDDTIEELGL